MKRREQTFLEGARRQPGSDELLQRRVNELGLRLEGTVLEVLLRELEYELLQKGIRKVKPRAYLTDEWGCPEGVPIIGIPAYLADQRLKRASKAFVEGDTASEILKYLRHEMGHVFNYAYRLYAREDWNKLFGSYARPYLENYQPKPFSRDFVRHIAGWYAQKHPDEDWSESFAVWLTPGSDWKKIYGAGALRKLEYVERIVAELGDKDLVVPQPGAPTADHGGVETLGYTVGEYIELYHEPPIEIPPFFDGDLRDLFDGRPEHKDAQAAAEFLTRRKRTLTRRVTYWTGVPENVVTSLVDHLIERSGALGLVAERRRTARRWIDIVAYVTTLCMNHLYQGSFIPGCPPPVPAAPIDADGDGQVEQREPLSATAAAAGAAAVSAALATAEAVQGGAAKHEAKHEVVKPEAAAKAEKPSKADKAEKPRPS